MSTTTDSDWKPSATLADLQLRARALTATRQFFRQRDALEVETPILSHNGNPDPNIQSFVTAGKHKMYLRTSPEFPLKRLLAAGYGDCYELGKVFRQAESGQFHNPEFSMLEWYRTSWTWRELAVEVIELIHFLAIKTERPLLPKWPLHWVSYQELFTTTTQLDPQSATPAEFFALTQRFQLQSPANMQRNEWLDFIMSMIIQPCLPCEGITIIHDFPASQAALAMLKPNNQETALRFEIYLGQQELANGYQELTNAEELEKRFQADNRARVIQNLPEVSLDQHLISAQTHGLPECAGVALGFDRLLMTLTGCNQIANCISFDSSRA